MPHTCMRGDVKKKSWLRSLHLDVMVSGVSDGGVWALAALPNLREISLNGTKLTDETAKALKSFPSLRFVDLRNTWISEVAAAKLRNARPDLTVSDDGCVVERTSGNGGD